MIILDFNNEQDPKKSEEFQQFKQFEVYESTMELHQAVDSMMYHGRELLTATNEQGKTYIRLLADAEQNLKKAIANIASVEAIKSDNESTRKTIAGFEEKAKITLAQLEAIKATLTIHQESKFDQMLAKIEETSNRIESNTGESVETAIRKSIENVNERYEYSLKQEMNTLNADMKRFQENTNNVMNESYKNIVVNYRGLESRINTLADRVETVTESLNRNLIKTVIGSSLLTTVFVLGFLAIVKLKAFL